MWTNVSSVIENLITIQTERAFCRQKKLNKPWNHIHKHCRKKRNFSLNGHHQDQPTNRKKKKLPAHIKHCDCGLHGLACIRVCLWLIVTIDDNHSIQLILSYFLFTFLVLHVASMLFECVHGVGLSFSVRIKLTDWLIADFDFSLFNTRFTIVWTTQQNR